MPPSERRVDAYIAAAQAFAQPILTRLREDVHAACPEAAEAIKWSMPFFVYGGRNLAHMAAFKAHCAFGFELGRAVVDLGREAQAMGQFGRITKLEDLPSRAELRRLVRKAAALIDAGQRAPRAPHSAKPGNGEAHATAKGAVRVPPLPPAFAEALAHDIGARRFFDTLAPSHRRDYVAWIAEAKRDQTRLRRVAQALAWLAEGKRRNWQYERARVAA